MNNGKCLKISSWDIKTVLSQKEGTTLGSFFFLEALKKSL